MVFKISKIVLTSYRVLLTNLMRSIRKNKNSTIIFLSFEYVVYIITIFVLLVDVIYWRKWR